MPRLAEADYRGALEVLYVAGEVEAAIPFPEPVLDALRRLVPCDVAAYHELPLGEPHIAIAGRPLSDVTQGWRAASRRLQHQDRLTPAKGARMFSDVFTRRQLHRLELYQEVCRPLGIEHMMRLWLDPRGARLELDRLEPGFSERDRAVLDLLLPHLQLLWRNAVRHRRRSASDRTDRLTPREREIVGLIAEGRTNAEVARQLWISPATVRKHLENAYEKLGVHTRTAAVAAVFPLDDRRYDS